MEKTVSKLIWWNPRILIGSSIAVAAVIAIAMTANLTVRMERPTKKRTKKKFISSPLRDVLLGLGKEERDALPYPPQGVFPEGTERDVESAVRIF